MNAIIYTSNTGTTAEYAKLLGAKVNLPVYSVEEARANVKAGAKVIYFGWIMAGEVKGYKKTVAKYEVCAVCAVGIGATGAQQKEVREKNHISSNVPLFTLQGGLDVKKLKGIYKIMMNLMVAMVGKQLANKADCTPEEKIMANMMINGGNHVGENNLQAVLAWLKEV